MMVSATGLSLLLIFTTVSPLLVQGQPLNISYVSQRCCWCHFSFNILKVTGGDSDIAGMAAIRRAGTSTKGAHVNTSKTLVS